MTLRPAILAILNRTRLARIELDAYAGLVPAGVIEFMSTTEDVLGQGLSDEDLKFLKSTENLRAPYAKLAQARVLIAEARTEIRAIVSAGLGDGSLEVKPKKAKATKLAKKAKAVTGVKFSSDGASELSHDQQLVLSALSSAGQTRPLIEDATRLKTYTVKTALVALRARKLAAMTGSGRGATWTKV